MGTNALTLGALASLGFGVEIETVGLTRAAVAEVLRGVFEVSEDEVVAVGGRYNAIDVFDARGRRWRVMRDGSLSDQLRGAEVVTPPLHYDTDRTLLVTVMRALHARGARADSSCGIHIHIDADAFSGEALGHLARLVYSREPHLYKALGVSDHRRMQYAKPIDTGFVARLRDAPTPRYKRDIGRIWYDGPVDEHQRTHYHQSRYHGLNYHAVFYHGTVEFRWFNGTLNAHKLLAYLHLCLALGLKALSMTRGIALTQHPLDPRDEKYGMRRFLVWLGLNGDDFAFTRAHLTELLAGSSRAPIHDATR
jgi:hypothetical protein